MLTCMINTSGTLCGCYAHTVLVIMHLDVVKVKFSDVVWNVINDSVNKLECQARLCDMPMSHSAFFFQ